VLKRSSLRGRKFGAGSHRALSWALAILIYINDLEDNVVSNVFSLPMTQNCSGRQGRRSHRIIGGDIKEDWGSGEWKSPSGVQGQSPSRCTRDIVKYFLSNRVINR